MGFGRVWEIYQNGGPVMHFLLLCSIIGVTIIIERARSLWKATVNTRILMDKVKALILQQNETALKLLLEETPGPVSRVLSTGYSLKNLPREEIVEGVKETAINEVARMERGLPTLSTLVTVATLLGLLGTILGLIQIYNVISGGRIGDAEALAAGIAQALITTATGLSIAIPFLIAHNILRQKVDSLTDETERSLHEFINFLKLEAIGHGEKVRETWSE